MTNEQKQAAQRWIDQIKRKLTSLEAGQHPKAQELDQRRMYADWSLCTLLHELDLAPVL